MSATAALVLYPTWAIAVLAGATASRLGRARGRGLVVLSFLLAYWVTALIAFAHPATHGLAERLIPAGMLLAGGFVHAGGDVVGVRARAPLAAAYALGVVVAILGALEPRWLYGPGLAGPGPLFVPMAIVSFVGVVIVGGWQLRLVRSAAGVPRARLVAVLTGNAMAVIAGGVSVAAYILGWLPDLVITAPCLLSAVLLIGWAMLAGELGRARQLVRQALVYGVLTATLSALGMALLVVLLPRLLPAPTLAWTLFVLFFMALPLDAARALFVEGLGRRLFARPTGVRDLADEVEREATRAEHVERLAEIGTITAAVAHEIRNPLGVIAAQAKLLERAGASAASVASLRAQVERAKRFVDDLLRYGQPRPLELAEVELAPAVGAAIAAAREGMGGTSVPIAASVPSGLALCADRAGLVDALVVLVQNAAIACGERAGAAVRVAARQEGATCVITVEDDGPGVPREIEDRLFAPFVSGRGRDHRHPGTGLGLAVASRWASTSSTRRARSCPARARRACQPTPCACSRRIPGRATCASCATRCSARSCCPPGATRSSTATSRPSCARARRCRLSSTPPTRLPRPWSRRSSPSSGASSTPRSPRPAGTAPRRPSGSVCRARDCSTSWSVTA